MVTPKGNEGESARAEILGAARALFAEHGFAGATMSALARKAGVSQGLIHHHFKSKRELWGAVGRSYLEEFGLELGDGLDAEPSLANLAAVLRRSMEFLVRRPELVRYASWCRLNGFVEVDAMEAEMFVAAQRFFERGQSAGSIRADRSARDLALVIHCAMETWTSDRQRLALLFGGALEPSWCERDDDILDTLITLLRPSPAGGCDLEARREP